MKTVTYLLINILPLIFFAQKNDNLNQMLWQRVQNCSSLLQNIDENDIPEYNKIDDTRNGYLKVFGEYPACGCTCSSTVGAYKDINGNYTLLQKEEFSCKWEKSISSNKSLYEVLPENFNINIFSTNKAIPESDHAVFFLDIDIPRIGTDTKLTLDLIPFGILKEQKNALITFNYSQNGSGEDSQNTITDSFYKLKLLANNIVNKSTLTFLLKKEYDHINKDDKKYIEQNIIASDSWGHFKSFDELSEKLRIIKNAYDIYSQLDFMSVLMRWNKEKGRFEIKSKNDRPKKVSFINFILENVFWGPVC
ncbi:MAG: hypothetical protein NXH86_16155 [Flavobacteriaceae bacterium]|uniref:hypothetical protein n=1 Tax=Flagellimonas sp. SN16 TaxID=3415142 RepID=UPI003C5437E0|nr:hypothetical protein [Flavobacteriaceae bacterium]